MAKIIQIKNTDITMKEILSRFERDRNTAILLEAVSFAVCNDIYESKDLDAAVRVGGDWKSEGDPLQGLGKVLRLFSVKPEARELPEMDSESASLIEEMLNASRSMDEASAELGIRAGSGYQFFRPAWLYAALLEKSYPGELNPGRIISEYCRMIFSHESQTDNGVRFDSEGYPRIPTIELNRSSPLLQTILELGELIIGKLDISSASQNIVRSAFDQIMNPSFRNIMPSDTGIIEYFSVLRELSPVFFFTWAYRWFLSERCNYGLSPKLTAEEVVHIYQSLRIDSAHETLFAQRRKVYLYEFMYHLLCKLDNSSDIFSTGGVPGLVTDFLANYKIDRRLLCSGASIYGWDVVENLASIIRFSADIKPNELDFTLLLGFVSHQADGLSTGYLVDDYDLYFLREEETLYEALVKLASAEVYPELGNALLSMVIFTNFFRFKGRLGNLETLIPLIEKGLECPGARILKHTIEFVVENTGKHFSDDVLAELAARRLRGYILTKRKLGVIEPHGKERVGKKVAHKQSAEEFLLHELGKARLDKLSEAAHNFLLSAETQWHIGFVEYGSGLKDMSGLVTQYCKVIEHELVERLQGFHTSSELEAFLALSNRTRPSSMTGGWLLRELGNAGSFSVPLMQLLDQSRIALHKDAALCKSISVLFAQYRNLAAHKDPLNCGKFGTFRTMYYGERLLHRFIDSLI